MGDIKAFLGRSMPFKDICNIYPPLVDDIIDNPSFFSQLNHFTITQEDIWDSMNQERINEDPYAEWERPKEFLTPFTRLVAAYSANPMFRMEIVNGFKVFTGHEFIYLSTLKGFLMVNEPIKEYLDKSSDFNDLEAADVKIIDGGNFLDFQNAIRAAVGQESKVGPDLNEHPKIARMKALRRIRDAKKSQFNRIDITTTLSSICCMGIGITPLNIGKVTYASINRILKTYQQKEDYEQKALSASVGMLDTKKHKIKHWIRNPEEEDD